MNFRNYQFFLSAIFRKPSYLWITGVIFLSGCAANQVSPTPQNPFPTSISKTATIYFIEITKTLKPPVTFPSSTTELIATKTPIPPVYVFPVQPVRFTGYAEGYAAHGYPAIDIFAPPNWAYVAVTNGVVEFISYTDDWDPITDDPALRGGISVAIIGDDGFRYYGSHLSRIEDGISPGMRVFAGQILGYVGKSGNARDRGTHLHFAISRPTYSDDWKTRRGEINPYIYLNAWLEGINSSPVYSTPTPKMTP
jgi:hypothetical protein